MDSVAYILCAVHIESIQAIMTDGIMETDLLFLYSFSNISSYCELVSLQVINLNPQ